MSVSAEGLRIYVGTEPKTEIARKVLQHSITIRTDAKVEFISMIGREWEYPKDIRAGTGFSLRRWMIAAHCKWQGKAVYLDADQIVLADIDELRLLANMPDPKVPDPVIWTTWQRDKHSPAEKAPQTSVMVIDCARAKDHWGFHMDKIVAHLRGHPERYPAFMHAAWLKGRVGALPTAWNHLNLYVDRKQPKPTKLLHYTKEPEQPWYKPDHPLADLWQQELVKAMVSGAVTTKDVEDAIAKWNVKEDWRTTNGLHPDYRRFLFVGHKKGPRPARPPEETAVSEPRPSASRPIRRELPAHDPADVLWVTSFNRLLHGASGHSLVDSFLATSTTGRLLCCGEVCEDLVPASARLLYYPLDQDPFLNRWLAANKDIIHADLGGQNLGCCRCPGGPFGTHSKEHRQPCVAQWFNKHVARWFRKIASLHHALEVARAKQVQFLIWIDSDCKFAASVTPAAVQSWFRVPHPGKFSARDMHRWGVGVFHFRSKRPVSETGIMGFNLHERAHGDVALELLFARYTSGLFRSDPRWDDSYQFDAVLNHNSDLKSADLARAVSGHADVIPGSEVGHFIAHLKGHHSRNLGLFT